MNARFLLGSMLVAVLAAAPGPAGSSASDPVGAARLRGLLAAAHVPVSRGETTAPASAFPAAWRAFRRFARIPPPDGIATSAAGDADLVFEFGVFESHFWGTSFEVELTRQDREASGELRQVHLVVHFPVAAFVSITRGLKAAPCLPGAGCTFRCFFAGDDSLVPRPCTIVSRGGYPIADMSLRASQTDGGGGTDDRARWLNDVESSAVFRALVSRHVRPKGFEVWQ